MSLETLLEAAKYLEYRSQVKARGEEPHDYYTFSKISSINSDVASIAAQSSNHRNSLPGTASSSNLPEEPKERRRTISSNSRESMLAQDHGGSGTREVHNKLEKNRRAHLKECFEALKKQLPNMDERKTSNLSILRGALRFIQTLKRKEREHEHDLEKLARDKIAFQQQLSALKKEIAVQYDHIDVNSLIAVDDNETTTTASECGGGSDLEEDFHNASSTSNPNSRLASDDTSSLSSSNATVSLTRSIATTTATTQALAFSKQASSTVFSSGLKGTIVKNNTLFATETISGGTTKVLSRPSQLDGHSGHAVAAGSEINAGHASRVISASNLQGMTGIISAPHTVQVITPPSSIKLLTATNSSAARQQGQIHVLTPTVSYVATSPIAAANGKSPATGEPMLHGADHRGKQQSISPITLVSSQAFVGLTQAATNSKPVIINQTSNFSEVMSPSSATQLVMKSSMFASNMALTLKNTVQNNSVDSQSLLNPALHAKAAPAQNLNSLISSEGGTLRQVAVSKAHSITSSTCNLLTHTPNMAQLVSQSPITVPAGQIIAPGVAPLVSVVSHTGALHPMLAQSQSLGKVLASPINQLNAIPIIQPQFLQTANSSQHIVKPVVVVSMPNIIHPNRSPLNQRPLISAADQCDSVFSSSSNVQNK